MNRAANILLTTEREIGAVQVLELLGLSAGELSTRKARDTYGKWFLDAVANGRLHPCRIEEGKAGTRYYQVLDILKLKEKDALKAELTF